MSFWMALRNLQGRVLGHYTRPLPPGFVEPLAGGRGLEIGGPTAAFNEDGILPVYPRLAAVDGVQPQSDTHWERFDPEAGFVIDRTRRGDLFFTDGVDLEFIPDGRYDIVIASHVIEHVANPLRALAAWRRVSRPHGHLLLVVPHLEGSFDHRRPVTTLEHMVQDFENGIEESDLTHLDEFLALHDSARNKPWTRGPEFEPRLRDNFHTRLMHHHTFTTLSVAALVRHAGLQILEVETRLPHDIFMLGTWAGGDDPSSAAVRAARRSPFRVDRRQAASAAS